MTVEDLYNELMRLMQQKKHNYTIRVFDPCLEEEYTPYNIYAEDEDKEILYLQI